MTRTRDTPSAAVAGPSSAGPVVVQTIDPAADGELAERLLAVQHAAYAVEAAIIGDDGIPPLHETLPELVAAGLTWRAVLDDGGSPLAAVATTQDEHLVDVDRLVVAPQAARQGLGRALVTAVLRDAAAAGQEVTVQTGRDNLPARRLYERFGFTHVTDVEPEPGLWVSSYRWRQRRAVTR
jgi:ribosomal protein S18 acetylase RimI-like enzyme